MEKSVDEILDHIKKDFNGRVAIRQKRPGIYQLFLPIYHEDGDMVDLFIKPIEKNKYILSDFGLTLQRLAYAYDIDTENKESILQKIVAENNLTEQEGNISLQTTDENIYTDILHITQVFSKIGSMRYFKREVIENLFYEILDEYIIQNLNDFHPEKSVYPIPEKEEYEADYSFSPNGHPVFLFGVKDTAKARLAIISCQAFQQANLNFRSLIVHEDFDKLSKKDRARLTNTCDKQYTTLEDFKLSVRAFLERERK